MKFVYVWLLVVIAEGFLPNVSCELKMVTILFRHGDRTPTNLYPKDPHLNYSWPGGFGVLTTRGIHNMIRLGQALRPRYQTLFPESGVYNGNIRAQSSYVERCIMSGLAFLAGFFPPPTNHKDFPIPWQPVTIYPIPIDDDNKIVQFSKCVKYMEVVKPYFSNEADEVKSLFTRDSEFLAEMSQHSGQEMDSLRTVAYLYDTLLVEELHNLPHPEWVTPQKIAQLREYSAAFLNVLSATTYMLQAKAGPFLTEVMTNMVKFASGETVSPRIWIYSGHDSTMVNILKALGVYSTDPALSLPKYGATLLLELHEEDDGKHVVKLVYVKSATETDQTEIPIPNCSEPCPLQDFVSNLRMFNITNFDQFCGNDV